MSDYTNNKGEINLQLRKFNMNWIDHTKTVLFIGKRGSGKSFCVKDFMFHHQDIPIGLVISRTEKVNSYYKDFIPDSFIYDKYDPDLIDKTLERQKVAIQEGWKDPRFYLIFDDCLADSNAWKKDERIAEIFMNGRHFKILYVLTMQYPLGIPPDLRTNIDYTFIFHENIYQNRKRIYEHYAGMFPDYRMFEQTMIQCTDNYGCLVIDNCTKSNKLEDLVYWYRAKDHGDNWRVGCDELWDSHNQEYAKNIHGHMATPPPPNSMNIKYKPKRRSHKQNYNIRLQQQQRRKKKR